MRRTRYALMVALALVMLLGCGVLTGTTKTIPLSTPINLELAIEKAPRLDEAIALTCTVKSIGYDAPASTASIELPEGAVLVDGDLSWEGDLERDVPIQFSATIKFVEEGEWEIKAVATHVVDEDSRWGDIDCIYLTVTKESGSFGWDIQPEVPAEKEGGE